MKNSWMRLFVLSLLPLVYATSALGQTHGVGLREFQVADPVAGAKMPAVAFYPIDGSNGLTRLPFYDVIGSKDAPPSAGRFPLIVFSHGTGGAMWGHHDFGSYLAAHGFIVAFVQHAGDNFRDNSGLGKDTVLIGRGLQLSALIDAALADPVLGSHIAPDRIGAAGFSAGGYTALLVAGAVPKFALLRDYCRENPHDPEFCTGWSVGITRPDLKTKADPRVKAVFAMAPVGLFFDKAGLAQVRVPVKLWDGANDEVLPIQYNVVHIQSLLPHRPALQLVPKAGHFVFLPPCSAPMQKELPRLCTDPAGVDRKLVHAEVNADAVRFFSRNLR